MKTGNIRTTEFLKTIWLSVWKLDSFQVTQTDYVTEMHLCSPSLLDLQLHCLNMHIKKISQKQYLQWKPKPEQSNGFQYLHLRNF